MKEESFKLQGIAPWRSLNRRFGKAEAGAIPEKGMDIHMKQRIITSFVCLVILFAVLAFFDTWLFNLVIAAIAALALYELLGAVHCRGSLSLNLVCCLYGAAIPFIPHGMTSTLLAPLTAVYIFLLFLILLREHRRVSAQQIGFCFFVSLAVPFAMSTTVYLRQREGWPVALGLILVALSGAWMSDTGAYFTGRFLGRHKLAPEISPKKTVEGAIGGVVVCVVFTLLILWGYAAICGQFFGVRLAVHYGTLALIMPLVSVSGMLGDLSASVIKRQGGLKDYGTIFPGHGGIMDRFDSALFTMPTVFLLSHYLTIIGLAA